MAMVWQPLGRSMMLSTVLQTVTESTLGLMTCLVTFLPLTQTRTRSEHHELCFGRCVLRVLSVCQITDLTRVYAWATVQAAHMSEAASDKKDQCTSILLGPFLCVWYGSSWLLGFSPQHRPGFHQLLFCSLSQSHDRPHSLARRASCLSLSTCALDVMMYALQRRPAA